MPLLLELLKLMLRGTFHMFGRMTRRIQGGSTSVRLTQSDAPPQYQKKKKSGSVSSALPKPEASVLKTRNTTGQSVDQTITGYK